MVKKRKNYLSLMICFFIFVVAILILTITQNLNIEKQSEKINWVTINLFLNICLSTAAFCYAKMKKKLYLWAIACSFVDLIIANTLSLILVFSNYDISLGFNFGYSTDLDLLPSLIWSIIIILSCRSNFSNKILRKKEILAFIGVVVLISFVGYFINVFICLDIIKMMNKNYRALLSIINVAMDVVVIYCMWKKYEENKDIYTVFIMIGCTFSLISEIFFFYSNSQNGFYSYMYHVTGLLFCFSPIMGLFIAFIQTVKFANEKVFETIKLQDDLLKFYGLVEQNNNSILIINKDSKIEFCNSAFWNFCTENFNVNIKEGMYLNSINIDCGEQIFNIIKNRISTLSYGKSSGDSIVIKNIYGKKVYLDISIATVSDFKTEELNYDVLICDRTENMSIADELKKSESKFSQVLENVYEFICKIDRCGHITYCSKSFIDTFGDLGVDNKKFWVTNVIELDKVKVQTDIELAFIYNNVVCNECTMNINNDVEITVEYCINPVVENDETKGAIISARDVTARKKVELELIESEKKYSDIFNMCPDIIYLIDAGSKMVLDVNPAACEFLNIEKENIVNKSIFQINKDHALDLYGNNEIIEYLNSGYVVRDHGVSIQEGENKKYLEVSYSPIAENNNIKMILCLARDCTERMNLQDLEKQHENNRKKLHEALEYDKVKTEFFANISHELRTPINVIFSALQVLDIYKEGLAMTPYVKYSKVMKQNCYRLLRLINNLIDITKIDAGYFNITMGDFNIVKIVEDITQSVVTYAENKKITLTFDTTEEEIYIKCDPDKIERIILNLLSNAIKFTNENGNIFVGIKKDKDFVQIVVEDDGNGIARDHSSIIFERFRQVDKSLARQQEGSGIGLSLVKSLVELHNGNISLESDIGKGSKFIINIPLGNVNIESVQNELHGKEQANIERINIEFSDIYDIS